MKTARGKVKGDIQGGPKEVSDHQRLLFAVACTRQRVYQFFKTAVEQSPNAEIQPVILENISDRIPAHLKNTDRQKAVLADLLVEVQEEYRTTIKAFTGKLLDCPLCLSFYSTLQDK